MWRGKYLTLILVDMWVVEGHIDNIKRLQEICHNNSIVYGYMWRGK